MANMVGQVLESHKIIFHEDELPPEKLNHNRALYITAQFEDKFIARVLVDGGSSLNICPLDTLKRLYYPLEQPVPHLDQDFHQADIIWGTAEEEALVGLKNLFLEEEDMDYNAIIKEEEEEGLTIQTVEKGAEVVREVENFENKPKSNLDETEAVNLGDTEIVKETRINIHLSPTEKEEYIHFLKEYEDIFAWSYDDMTGLSTSIAAHKLPTNLTCLLVKQKLRKFKPDMSLKIKEEVTNQIKAKDLRVVEYPTWLANIVPVLKNDGKVRNARATYMRAMTTIFHDMIHKEIKVYVDDIIIKSKRAADHITDLRKFFDRLKRYNLKLNPTKCAFRIPAGKLLGFIISHRGIELDSSKVKAIQELSPPRSKKDVMSFLGCLNYISRFIAHSTVICEPIFKMLKKDAETSWTEDCQKAFDKIKEYLSTPPVLVLSEPG
ncbi:uncharacterized protein [Nicotiana sylvestris]|uniref:uncharacterized protein n=1 Tax=Nicotiana sylvestris TaxID=4096 RepID=UPI00388CA9A0